MEITTKGFQFSASKLKTFKLCRKQYFYKYVSNIRMRERKNTAALFGTAMHKAIEMKYRENKSPGYIFNATMNEILDEWQLSGEEITGVNYLNSYLTEGKRILSEFDWSLYQPFDADSLERKFSLKFPANQYNATITGFIDMITADGDGYSIVDYKTSKKPETAEELAQNPQFILYRWAGIQLFGYPPKRVIWHQLRTGEQHEARVDVDFDLKIQELSDIVAEMIEAQEFPLKEKDSFCTRLCSFYSLCYGE